MDWRIVFSCRINYADLGLANISDWIGEITTTGVPVRHLGDGNRGSRTGRLLSGSFTAAERQQTDNDERDSVEGPHG